MIPLHTQDETDLTCSDDDAEMLHDAMHVSAAATDKDAATGTMDEITPWRHHARSMAALCLCMLTHSYLLISVFPYSGYLAIHYIPSANEETAGRYAGFVAASFMVGRTLSSYLWGKMADRYGRKFVLIASLVLSCIFSILFGLAPTFALAILWRCLLGFGNGMVGTAKTAVSELAGGDEALETRGMGIVLGMWGWGFLLSPAISGALAEPVRQYPNRAWVQRFEGVLSKYPFLLPNLVGAMFCLTAMVAVILFVPETLCEEKLRSSKYIVADFWTWRKSFVECHPRTRLKSRVSSIEFTSVSQQENDREEVEGGEASFDKSLGRPNLKAKQSELYLNNAADTQVDPFNDPDTVTMSSLWARSNTRRHLITYWIFSFSVIAIDEAFPLFCISKEAGLGLSEASIGRILSGSGLLFAVSQYCVYGYLVNRYGLYGSIRIGSLVSSLLMVLFPFSVLIAQGSVDDEMTWTTYSYLCVIAAGVRVFCLAFFSSITIATNRTVPTALRGSMNGLSMLGGSVSKAMGPAFAGILVTFFLSSGFVAPRAGAFLIFVVIASMSFISYLCSVTLDSNLDDEDESFVQEQNA